jgi:urease accessory protein
LVLQLTIGNRLPDYPITQLPDSRAPSLIGRTARLELSFEYRRGRTVLARSYAEPPFRIARVFDLNGAAYVILVCAGPGVFSGDTFTQTIRAGRGARVVLASQAAMQVHPSIAAGDAVLRQTFAVEDAAELHCHWDPVIPFAGSRLDQRIALSLAGSSCLYWSDAMMAGRVSRGEAWQFDRLAHEVSVHVDGGCAYLERYAVIPAERGVQRRFIAGEATHLSTIVARHPAIAAETAEAAHHLLASDRRVTASADLPAPMLSVARIMSNDGASFSRTRASYREWMLAAIFQHPELAGRK